MTNQIRRMVLILMAAMLLPIEAVAAPLPPQQTAKLEASIEIAGARDVLRRYAKAQTPSALASILSNRSAGAYGISYARKMGAVIDVFDSHHNDPGSHEYVVKLTDLFNRYDAVDPHRALPPLPSDSPLRYDSFMRVLLRLPATPDQLYHSPN